MRQHAAGETVFFQTLRISANPNFLLACRVTKGGVRKSAVMPIPQDSLTFSFEVG